MAYMYIGGCDSFPPAAAEIKAQLEARVANKKNQTDNHIISTNKRLCFVYPVDYGSLVSITRTRGFEAGDEIITAFIATADYFDGINYNVYTLGSLIDNIAGEDTYTYYFDDVPLPRVYPPGTIVPYIYPQPDYHGIVYTRSPVIYGFRDCNPIYNYVVYLYATTGSTADLGFDIVGEVTRKPDLTGLIWFDASFLLQNYIKTDLQYYSENVIYINCALLESDVTDTIRSFTTSDVCKATLGYTHYMAGGGAFNYNEGAYAPIQVDFLMNSNQNNVPYYIPNYGYGRFIYNWKKATATNDKWRILYTNLSGITVAITPGFDPINVAADEVQTIYCGYYDLINYWGVTSLDITKPIFVQTLIGTDVSYNFPLYPVSCNGQEPINIQFMNKWGVWERFFCYGKIDKSLEVTYDQYKYNKVNYNNAGYDVLAGSYHKMNVQGRNKMVVQTGWLPEVFNTKIEELLMSEYVLYEPYIGGATPIIITDKEIKFKTDKNDKVINYSFTIEYAFDKINNVV